MKIKSNGKTFRIVKGPSIFTNRNNASDVTIYESGHCNGTRFEGENSMFAVIAIISSETGSIIKKYGPMPKCINVVLLRQWGFVECENTVFHENVKLGIEASHNDCECCRESTHTRCLVSLNRG